MQWRISAILKAISYDLCVLTGDYRGPSSGPYEGTLETMSRISAELKKPAASRVHLVRGDGRSTVPTPESKGAGVCVSTVSIVCPSVGARK